MDNSKDTIIIQGISQKVEGKEFIKFIERVGPIKTNRDNGHRMAEIRQSKTEKYKEGIATFEDKENVRHAIKVLNETELHGTMVKVSCAENYGKEQEINRQIEKQKGYNTAWFHWKRNKTSDMHHPVPGKGGEGGKSFFPFPFNIFSRPGQPGQPGEDGVGGRGGAGGKGGSIW